MGTTTMKKWHTMHTQPHEPLFVGWIVRGMTTTTDDNEQQQQNDRTTMARQLMTGRRRGQGKLNEKKGPRDIDDVSWATGMFLFLFSRSFSLTNKLFRY
jgi:hypothetical protein